MTPMIDVVFLLIVFFMLICQFISQDNERLVVPDQCSTVTEEQYKAENEIIVQVWSQNTDPDTVIFSVGQNDFTAKAGASDSFAALISELSDTLKAAADGMQNPIIRLRGDGRLSCSQVRPAIKAAAAAGLANIRFAAFKDIGPELK